MLSRRRLLLSGLALSLTGSTALAQSYGGEEDPFGGGVDNGGGELFDPALLPPAESLIDFPVPVIPDRRIKKQFRRQMVDFEGPEQPGTLVVDPDNRFLYHVLAHGTAMRYGVGVGRAGFAWAGHAQIGMKRRWPRWVPPAEMVQRDPRARQWVNGQPGGPDNPLGARAIYIGGTQFRIHGTTQPWSIGQAMSSGCIRMMNAEIIDLYNRVQVGATVVVE